MARKGSEARSSVENTIIKSFGNKFVAVDNKKIYVMASDDDGESFQFAISITMPKNPLPVKTENMGNTNDWTNEPILNESTETNEETVFNEVKNRRVELDEKEQDFVDQLMKELNIID